MRHFLPLLLALAACNGEDPETELPDDTGDEPDSGPYELGFNCVQQEGPDASFGIVFALPDEKDDWLIARHEYDSNVPGTIDEVSFVLMESSEPDAQAAYTWTCKATFTHEVAVWVQEAGEPLASPPNLVTRSVTPPSAVDAVSRVVVDVSADALAVQPGQLVYVAIQNNSDWTNNSDGTFTGDAACFRLCPGTTGDDSFWSFADAVPYSFDSFASEGFPGDLEVTVSGDR